ncbi:MAG: hypothetical protein IT303_19095 [Dehalococcoidia bacterium]|nr:hypothetical protein [Dehalococcoidia bacterium]
MRIAVLTRDLMFFTAAEGIAGATGHEAVQVEDAANAAGFDLFVVDLAPSTGIDLLAVAMLDPLRTAAFIPHVQVERLTGARAAGLAEVHRRGALAQELPRIIAQHAG